TAAAGGEEGLADDVGVADGLEGDVDAVAVADERAHLLGGVVAGGAAYVEDVGCAERLGPLELLVDDVDGDDAGGAGDTRSLDDVDADAAAAEDGDGLAGLDARGVDGGADAGHDAAADETGAIERDVVIDLDGGRGVDDGAGGERAQPAEV